MPTLQCDANHLSISLLSQVSASVSHPPIQTRWLPRAASPLSIKTMRFSQPPSARTRIIELTRNDECRRPNLSSPGLPEFHIDASAPPVPHRQWTVTPMGWRSGTVLQCIFPRPQDCAVGGSGGSGSCAGRRWADSLFVPVNCWRSWGGIQSHRQPVPFPWDRSLPAGLGRKLQGKARASCSLLAASIQPTTKSPLSCLAPAWPGLLVEAPPQQPQSPTLNPVPFFKTANGSDVARLARFKAPSLFMRASQVLKPSFPLLDSRRKQAAVAKHARPHQLVSQESPSMAYLIG